MTRFTFPLRLIVRLLISVGLVVLAGGAAKGAERMVPSNPATSTTLPNIVLILADDLGYGDLGCYGQQRIKTPHLDAMAKQGVRFTQFYAGAPVCSPSRNVLLTGQHTGHTTIRGNAKIDLRPQDFTIGELLQKAGYTTGLIGKWGLGKEGSTGYPLKKGFDYFFGYVDQTMAHNYYPTYLVRNNERVPLRNVVPNPGKYDQGVASVKLDYSADLLAEDALKFIREHRSAPFFLCFTATLPHANGEAKPDGMEIPDYGIYAKENWRNQAKGYAAMVTLLDAQVGQMMGELKALDLDENTLVIFTSDNGPHNEGGNDATFFESSGPLRGVKRDLYEGGIREPMIVRWPARVAGGTTSDHVGYFGDFMATFAEIAGVDAPKGLDSLSFLPALQRHGAAQKTHDYLYWEFYEGASAQSVRIADWKILRSPMKTGALEVYDLSKDLGETRNVAAQQPEIVRRALVAMDQAHVESPLWKPGAVAQPGKLSTE
ncbi:MAG: arylsulfatase [Opitutus sp.]